MIKIDIKKDNIQTRSLRRRKGQIVTLAIDQATNKSGYSIFKNGELEVYGTIQTTASNNLIKRIDELIIILRVLIFNYEPDYIAIEDVQLQRNTKGLISLSKLLGSLELELSRLKIPYEVISSNTWKSTCKIKGRKRDEQEESVKDFVFKTYNIEEVAPDSADAIAINYHLNKILEEKRGCLKYVYRST